MPLFNLPIDRYWRDPSITTWKFLSLCLNPSYYTPKVKRERKLSTNTLRTGPPYSRTLTYIQGYSESYLVQWSPRLLSTPRSVPCGYDSPYRWLLLLPCQVGSRKEDLHHHLLYGIQTHYICYFRIFFLCGDRRVRTSNIQINSQLHLPTELNPQYIFIMYFFMTIWAY